MENRTAQTWGENMKPVFHIYTAPVAGSDLLSCPFCRNQNISVEWEKCDRISSDDTERLWWCECRYCGSHGPCANTEPEAKHRWQTRAHEFNPPIWEQRKRNPLGQDNI